MAAGIRDVDAAVLEDGIMYRDASSCRAAANSVTRIEESTTEPGSARLNNRGQSGVVYEVCCSCAGDAASISTPAR